MHSSRGGGFRWTRRWKVALGIGVGSLLVLGSFAFWVVRQIDPPGGPGDPVSVEIPSGSSASAIAVILEEHDVITSARIFRFYVRLKGSDGFQAGIYGKGEFRTKMAMGKVVAALRAGPQIAYERLTIPEGFTLGQIAERVGELDGRSSERFLEAVASGTMRSKYQPDGVESLEGLLFPDTYLIAEDEDEGAILARMVTLFDQVADAVGLADGARGLGRTPYELIVVASLVEEETKIADERPLVSAVIRNRLERGMLLQIDATVLYALGAHKDRVLFRDLEVDSPYNTYRNAGLPPTPIAAPGRDSLAAAAAPADSPFLFYVKIAADGRHKFAETAAEHGRNVAEARRLGIR